MRTALGIIFSIRIYKGLLQSYKGLDVKYPPSFVQIYATAERPKLILEHFTLFNELSLVGLEFFLDGQKKYSVIFKALIKSLICWGEKYYEGRNFIKPTIFICVFKFWDWVINEINVCADLCARQRGPYSAILSLQRYMASRKFVIFVLSYFPQIR